jgi:fructose-1,6-bisphosphatase/sedoheptulose 1,7-bisphosphatase-like protein
VDEPLWPLLRATEAAALAASGHVGRGDKLAVDRAATEALRAALGRAGFAARVAIGEGKKDDAPGLFADEVLGTGPPRYDLAIDPVDGTTQAARGGRDSLAAVALAGRDCLFRTEQYYMRRVAVGPTVAARLDGDWLRTPVPELLAAVARIRERPVSELTVCVLDRPRHRALINELRQTSCRVELVDCDVASAVAVAVPGAKVDACLGIGGSPETVLAAAALRCLGGDLRAMVLRRDETPADGRILTAADLARGPVCFAASGVTDGRLLRGVRDDRRVHSLLLSSEPRALHWVESEY